MNTDDKKSGSIRHKFSMAETEVTYELWKKVYDWANKGSNPCNTATRQYCYTFANAGTKGGMYSSGYVGNLAGNDEQPVTRVSWRDAIVWSNAYTEWSNAEKGTNYTLVYYTDANYTKPLRTSTNDAPQSKPPAGSEDNPYIKYSNHNTGFRLPTSEEWEFAARLRKDATNAVANGKPSGVNYPISIGGTDYWFTKGNSASGADHVSAVGNVAWYYNNSSNKTLDGTIVAWVADTLVLQQ